MSPGGSLVATVPGHGAHVLQYVVAPPLFVFVLFVAMLVAVGRTWPWDHRPASMPSPGPPLSRLARHLVATAAAGYVVFLLVVGAFEVLIGARPVSVVGDAAWGGAFLGFVVAVPVFLAVAATTGRRRR